MKKGFTLIELIVAVAIFVIVATLAIGGFLAIAKTKTMMDDMKETQQKERIIAEMITRLAKEADWSILSPAASPVMISGQSVDAIELQYPTMGGLTPSTVKIFSLAPSGGPYTSFTYYDCSTGGGRTYTYNPTTPWDVTNCSSEDLLQSSVGTSYQINKAKDAGGNDISVFSQNNTIPATLDVNFVLNNLSAGVSAGNDSITYSNRIIMEGLK